MPTLDQQCIYKYLDRNKPTNPSILSYCKHTTNTTVLECQLKWIDFEVQEVKKAYGTSSTPRSCQKDEFPPVTE